MQAHIHARVGTQTRAQSSSVNPHQNKQVRLLLCGENTSNGSLNVFFLFVFTQRPQLMWKHVNISPDEAGNDSGIQGTSKTTSQQSLTWEPRLGSVLNSIAVNRSRHATYKF